MILIISISFLVLKRAAHESIEPFTKFFLIHYSF